MGSEFLGTYVQHDICHTDHKANCDPPFSRDQVIRRVRCFMDQRDKSGKTNVSFSVENLCVKACKILTLKKIFAPPFGVLANGRATRLIETKPIPIKAGLEFKATDDSYTLWMVGGSSDLHNEYVLSLYDYDYAY